MAYRILAIDGGGVRGIMPAVWLRHIEEKIGKPLHECFDMFCGTSSGAISASAISAGNSAADIHERFRSTVNNVFPSALWWLPGRILRTLWQGLSAPKYSDYGLRKTLQKEFGTLKFGDLSKPTLVTAFDLWNRKPMVFKSYHPQAKTRDLWEIIKCSTSAPIFLPAHNMEIRGEMVSFIDGAVVANNPSMIAVAEAIALGIDINDVWVLSLGTGELNNPIEPDQASSWGAIQWLPHIWKVMGEGGVEAADYEARKVLQDPERYCRIQNTLEPGFDSIDDSSTVNMNNLENAAEMHIANQPQMFDKVIEELSK